MNAPHRLSLFSERFRRASVYLSRVGQKIDAVIGLESRGYYFGVLLAAALRVPFVPFRKPGKLPGEIAIVEYQLEYGAY